MSSSNAVAPLPAGKTYIFPIAEDAKGRRFVNHGFTTESLIKKRYTENTTAASVTLNVMLPFLNAFNTRLEAHIKDGRDLSAEEALRHVADCGALATINYVDVITRVAIQTGLACYFIKHPSAAGNATVYLWDAYPRMHRKYIGDVIVGLRLPKFIATLLGGMPSEKDLAIYDTKAPFMNIYEDSVRRHFFTTVSDIIVTSVRLAITNTINRRRLYKEIAVQAFEDEQNSTCEEDKAEARVAAIAKRKEADAQNAIGVQVAAVTAQKVIVLLGRAVGAGLGSMAKGGVGEYWGEMFGGILVAGYAAALLSSVVKSKKAPVVAAADVAASEE